MLFQALPPPPPTKQDRKDRKTLSVGKLVIISYVTYENSCGSSLDKLHRSRDCQPCGLISDYTLAFLKS